MSTVAEPRLRSADQRLWESASSQCDVYSYRPSGCSVSGSPLNGRRVRLRVGCRLPNDRLHNIFVHGWT